MRGMSFATCANTFFRCRNPNPKWMPRQNSRRQWIVLLLAAISVCALHVTSAETTSHVGNSRTFDNDPDDQGPPSDHGPRQRPNVVLIIADDLGMGDLGCYGNKTLRTPHIDRMAKEGALFTHALAAASICTPSRTAILTGRYPIRAGMATKKGIRVVPFTACRGGLPPGEITFAKLAQERGYSTAFIGKWHLGLHCWTQNDFCHHPLKQGFDFYYGVPWTNARDIGDEQLAIDRVRPYFRSSLLATSLASTVAIYFFLKGKANRCFTALLVLLTVLLPAGLWLVASSLKVLNGILMRDYTVVEQPFRVEGIHLRFLREARNFITAQSNMNTPFVLVFSFTHVHSSLKPTPEFKGQSQHGLYGDAVEEMDWAVGQLMSHLKNLGLRDSTAVFFTSDNGGHLEEVSDNGHTHGGFNGPFKGGKGMGGMEGGIRVPTLAWWPDHIPSGLRIDWPISNMDFYPTIAQMLGMPIPRALNLDGENLFDLIPALNEHGARSGHQEEPKRNPRFLVHYCGTHIHAVRLIVDKIHIWKAHFTTPNWLPNTTRCHYMCPCNGNGVTQHRPPILYNIATDLYENQPILSSTKEYQEIMAVIDQEIRLHKASIKPVEQQLDFPNFLWLPWLQPCCSFPTCSCTEQSDDGTPGIS